MRLGSISYESPLFKQHYLWQYVQLLHNRLLYRCTSILRGNVNGLSKIS